LSQVKWNNNLSQTICAHETLLQCVYTLPKDKRCLQAVSERSSFVEKRNDITVERNAFADEIGFSDKLAYAEGIAGNTDCVDEVVGGLYIGKVIDDDKVPKILIKPDQRGRDAKERTKRRCLYGV
jgi:hypothetical protein